MNKIKLCGVLRCVRLSHESVEGLLFFASHRIFMEATRYPVSSRVDMGPARPPKVMKNTFCLATALH